MLSMIRVIGLKPADGEQRKELGYTTLRMVWVNVAPQSMTTKWR